MSDGDMNIAGGLVKRWAKFSAVGATGIAVQIVTLSLLLKLAGLHYLLATAIAVEASVIHNFIWHCRWTWSDRTDSSRGLKLLKFNLTTGALSMVGNLVLMALFVSGVGLSALAANAVTIAICSIINFAVSDRFVFV